MAPTTLKSEKDTEDFKTLAKALDIEESKLSLILTKINTPVPSFIRNYELYPTGFYNYGCPWEDHICTLLQHMVQLGFWDSVPFVLRMGADVNFKDEIGRTILHEIALNLYPKAPPHDIVSKLISKDNIDCQTTTDKETALHNASHYQPSLIPLLVKKGCDINIRCNMGRVGLHGIVGTEVSHDATKQGFGRSDVENWIELCISPKAIKTADRDTGLTPLFSAVFFREWDNVDLLLTHGASVNHRNEQKETPLMYSFTLDEGKHKIPTPMSIVAKLMPKKPLERYRALIMAMHLTPEDETWWFDIISSLLDHLIPLKLSSFKLRKSYNPGLLFINGKEGFDPGDPCQESLVMICTLMQETCFCKQVRTSMFRDHAGKDFAEVLEAMGEELNTEPSSLFKLTSLTIRSVVLNSGSSQNFEQLGLPKYLVSLVKLEPLGRCLLKLWQKYKAVEKHDAKSLFNEFSKLYFQKMVPFY